MRFATFLSPNFRHGVSAFFGLNFRHEVSAFFVPNFSAWGLRLAVVTDNFYHKELGFLTCIIANPAKTVYTNLRKKLVEKLLFS